MNLPADGIDSCSIAAGIEVVVVKANIRRAAKNKCPTGVIVYRGKRA